MQWSEYIFTASMEVVSKSHNFMYQPHERGDCMTLDQTHKEQPKDVMGGGKENSGWNVKMKLNK